VAQIQPSAGMSPDAVRESLERITQSRSVMLATNEIMGIVAVAFAVAACFIWLARRPTRSVDLSQTH